MDSAYPGSQSHERGSSDATALGRANQIRAEATRSLAAGDYERALRLTDEASKLIDSVIEPLAASDPASPAAFVGMQQALLVCGDLALTYSLLGRPDQAEEPMRQAQLLLDRARRPMSPVAGVCLHGRTTYDPDGDCLFIPPCPPAT